MKPIKLKYSEPLMRDAVRAYWWRQVASKLIFPLVVLTALLIYRIVDGDRTWFVRALGGTVAFTVAAVAASYFVHLRNALRRLREMETPEVTMELDNERLLMKSDTGVVESQWAFLRHLWRLDAFWLLSFWAGDFVTLPTADLTPEAREFIVSKAEEKGTKIAE